MPSTRSTRSVQTQVPIRVSRRRRRSLDDIIMRLESNIDEILRQLEFVQNHVSSLRRQAVAIQQEIKSEEIIAN